jgi:hypothetical protein
MMPALETDATLGAELDHVAVLPLTSVPLWSLAVKVACVVCPIPSDVVGADTVTVVTGKTEDGEVVIVTDPLLPSLVAVTVDVPEPTAVTVPDGETVKTLRLELDHAIVRPVSVLPWASFKVTPIVCVCPTNIEVEVTDSVTVATGAGAVDPITSVADPD